MMSDAMWNYDEPVTTLGIEPPVWIDQDITAATVAAIVQGGCESGAYMPAVTYWQALETMGKHDEAVLDFIDEHGGLPAVNGSMTLTGYAVHCLSYAVDLWASSVESIIEEALEHMGDGWVYELGHNNAGYMPDCEPALFDDCFDAFNALHDLLVEIEDQNSEDGFVADESLLEAQRVVLALDWKPETLDSQGRYTLSVCGVEYWVQAIPNAELDE